jgi:hypothetical protein
VYENISIGNLFFSYIYIFSESDTVTGPTTASWEILMVKKWPSREVMKKIVEIK